MARRKTGLSQQLAQAGATAGSTGAKAQSTQRSFAPTGSPSQAGTQLNQQANNPRYGQRFKALVKGGEIVHQYADGTTIDIGPLTKGRATPGQTLQQAGATLHDALGALTQKSEQKLIRALADHYANLTAHEHVVQNGPMRKAPGVKSPHKAFLTPAETAAMQVATPPIMKSTDRHFLSAAGGGQNVSLGHSSAPTMDLNAVYYPKGSTRPRIARNGGDRVKLRRGGLVPRGTRVV